MDGPFRFDGIRSIPYMLDTALISMGIKKNRMIRASVAYNPTNIPFGYRFHKSSCFVSINQNYNPEQWNSLPPATKASIVVSWVKEIMIHIRQTWSEMSLERIESIFTTINQSEFTPEFEVWKSDTKNSQIALVIQYSLTSAFLIARRKGKTPESILIQEIDPNPIIYQLVFSKCRIDGENLVISNSESSLEHFIDISNRRISVKGTSEYSNPINIDQALRYISPFTSKEDRLRIMMNM